MCMCENENVKNWATFKMIVQVFGFDLTTFCQM